MGGGSVLVIALLVAALGWLHRRTRDLPDAGWGARVWVQLTFGLYLGWVCVATCANVALALVGSGVPAAGALATVLTLVVLLVVLAVFAVTAGRLLTHRWSVLAVAAAIAWGLGWAAFARYAGELRSIPVTWVAALVALLVLVLAALRSVRLSRPATR
ncbi:hypothetical protein CGZ93_12335 [Enemella dayhoffiae]|uniref:Tryptophan-rich sensory protein n=1 Tax=Enemella dayhoffiae TaxID=2016507 RepID=A0A255GZD4_9ACTN|nr:hypothetical protein CGZ93_12335 [Enemella dayhoffiae]